MLKEYNINKTALKILGLGNSKLEEEERFFQFLLLLSQSFPNIEVFNKSRLR
jgi:hypothetical protein